MNTLDLFYIPAALLTAPVWMRKSRGGWGERFGRVEGMLTRAGATEGIPAADRPRILLHAVSVGEANALRPLVPLLVDHADVIISTTTDTGLTRAKALFADRCEVVRYPLDFSWAVCRFLDAVKPDAVGLVELELWPNFLKACAARNIPAAVINGRLSERSFAGYHRWHRLTGGMFRSLEVAAVQDDAYAERFRAMGVQDDRCRVTGSMKWDAIDVSGDATSPSDEARELGIAMGIDPALPLIVAGSTGPGEEALLHEACPDGVQLACAARKPERFDEAAAAMPGCVRRTTPAASSTTGRFLLDTIGELGMLYQLADVVVVGRTFAGLGGSDPIEPIALGKPTVVGPDIDNFRSIVEVFDRAGGIVRTDRAGLAGQLGRLIDSRPEAESIAANGRAAIRGQQGASTLHSELMLNLAKSSLSPG